MDLVGASTQEMAREILKRAMIDEEGKVDAAYAVLTVLPALRGLKDPEAQQELFDAETFVVSVRDMAIADLVKAESLSPKVDVMSTTDWMALGIEPDPADPR